MRIRSRRAHGQVLLEYALMILVVAIPMAGALRIVMEDQDGDKKNLLYQLVKDSYGDNGRMGVIGRPYP